MRLKFETTSLAAGLLLLSSFNANATVVTFESGVGGCSAMSNLDTFTNQCAADNVTGSTNDYYYVDPRDTFDGQGVSNTITPGELFFTAPVNNLSMDYVLIGGVTANFDIFDASHVSLGTFSDNAISGNVNASHSWGGTGIAELDWSGNTGVIGISTLRFTTVSVPAPLIGRGLPVLLAVGGILFGAEIVARGRKRRSPGTQAVPVLT